MVSHPFSAVGEVELMDEEEMKALMKMSRSGGKTSYRCTSIVEAVNQQCAEHADTTALTQGTLTYSYSELNTLSNQFALFLRAKYAVRKGDVLAVEAKRSPQIILAMLAVMKSGAVYVPLDLQYPEDRLGFIQQDSGYKVLINELVVNEFLSADVSAFRHEVLPEIISTDPAYIIYTSGTTGKPKGVLIEHGSLLNSIMAQKKIVGLWPGSRCLQFCAFSFDASLYEIFVALMSGASLYVAEDEIKNNCLLLESYISSNEIDMVSITPSYLRLMNIDFLKRLKKLLSGGESPAVKEVNTYLQHVDYYNAYGPTETTIAATMFVAKRGAALNTTHVPLGKPLANVSAYVVGDRNKICPVGFTGELYIGGTGVAAWLSKSAATDFGKICLGHI